MTKIEKLKNELNKDYCFVTEATTGSIYWEAHSFKIRLSNHLPNVIDRKVLYVIYPLNDGVFTVFMGYASYSFSSAKGLIDFIRHTDLVMPILCGMNLNTQVYPDAEFKDSRFIEILKVQNLKIRNQKEEIATLNDAIAKSEKNPAWGVCKSLLNNFKSKMSPGQLRLYEEVFK